MLESITNCQSTPSAFKIIVADEVERRLPVEAKVNGRAGNLIVKTQYTIHTNGGTAVTVRISLFPAITPETNVATASNVPFQSGRPIEIAMYFVETGKAETIIVEVTQTFQCPVILYKMFNRYGARIYLQT